MITLIGSHGVTEMDALGGIFPVTFWLVEEM